MDSADQLMRVYLARVEADLGTRETTNGQLDDYMTRQLGPELFRGVYDVSGKPGDTTGTYCYIMNTQPVPAPGHWLLVAHAPGRTPVAFDSYARDFGPSFQPHLAGHARTHADVDQFRRDHCGQLCCAAAMIFRDYGLDVMRAAA
jgi:hypothetical protein